MWQVLAHILDAAQDAGFSAEVCPKMYSNVQATLFAWNCCLMWPSDAGNLWCCSSLPIYLCAPPITWCGCCVGLQALAFGMGGGLLQRVNRDTMNFATKVWLLCTMTVY